MEEKNTKRFKGWFIPEHVVSLFEEEVINVKEVILLATIDSFANGKEGCHASNTYLGKKIQTGADRTGRMIAKLKELGLVKQTSFDGRERYLETYWSMKPQPKHRSRPGKNTVADPVKTPYRQYKETNTPSPNINVRRGRPSKLGRSPTVPTSLDGDSTWDTRAAGYLREVLIKYDSDLVTPPNSVRVDTLAKKSIGPLRVSRGVAKDEIKAMIKWLKEHYGETYTPKMHKADDLYRRWEKYRVAKQGWEHDNQSDNSGAPIRRDEGDGKVPPHGKDLGFGFDPYTGRAKLGPERSKVWQQVIDYLDEENEREGLAWNYCQDGVDQKQLNRALNALGRELDYLTLDQMMSRH